jgi:hypothetical protein
MKSYMHTPTPLVRNLPMRLASALVIFAAEVVHAEPHQLIVHRRPTKVSVAALDGVNTSTDLCRPISV